MGDSYVLTLRTRAWGRIFHTVAMVTGNRPIRKLHAIIQIWDGNKQIWPHALVETVILNVCAKNLSYSMFRFWVTFVPVSQVCDFYHSEIWAVKKLYRWGRFLNIYALDVPICLFFSIEDWIIIIFEKRIIQIRPTVLL